MKYYEGDNFAQVYKDLLNNVLNKPEYVCTPRGMEIREITNLQFTIKNPISSLYRNQRRSSQFKYIAAELIWYFSGSCDVEFIKYYAKFWENIVNEDNTLNSAYGNLIFNTHNGTNQWNWAYESLLNDKEI
jgi:thymidylate synthase